MGSLPPLGQPGAGLGRVAGFSSNPLLTVQQATPLVVTAVPVDTELDEVEQVRLIASVTATGAAAAVPGIVAGWRGFQDGPGVTCVPRRTRCSSR